MVLTEFALANTMIMNTSATFGLNGSRLGNQLFQYGLLYAIQSKKGYPFFLSRNGEQFWNCFDCNPPEIGETTTTFLETVEPVIYNPRVFDQLPGTSFDGYYQAWPYYADCVSKLQQHLRFKREHALPIDEMYRSLKMKYPMQPIVSIHYRRRDYVSSHCENHWGNLHTDGFYGRVVGKLKQKCLLLICSDDIQWCTQNVNFPDHDMMFINFDEYKTLYLMTRCDKNIISNSTYAWWGAFLNPWSEVHAPSRWYGRDHPLAKVDKCDHTDIVAPGWNKEPTFQG